MIDWEKVWKEFWEWAEEEYPVSLNLHPLCQSDMRGKIRQLVEKQIKKVKK